MTSYKDLGYDKVFVSLDGSEQQKEVLNRAIIVAANNNASLVIGHVVDTTGLEATGVNVAEAVPAKEAEFMASIQEDLERAKNTPEITEVEVMVRPGRIRETLKEDLLDVAQPDIVICGARGLSSIKYALLGSISQFLVKTCECDVLVVK